MRTLFRASVIGAFCACVAGCATTGATPYAAIPVRSAGETIAIGKSTKADVLAALGKTTAVRFESGYEVWVYQLRGELRSGGEFVVLFAPSGIVRKTRIRPAPA